MNTTTPIKYFIYARKSSEAEDRQIASIDSQIEELTRIAARERYMIVEVLSEARSAKEPGRPVFNYMVEQILQKKAQGILCWKLDRLARNPVDGGNIIWFLQRSVIKHVVTYEKHYYPTDNVLLMSIEFGMATQYVRDLSVNVKRGLTKKVNEGVLPGVAPTGYLNTPDRERGCKLIVEDPVRFPLIRKMWDLLLSGSYTPPKILELANTEWGFRTIKRRKIGGGPMQRSTIYKIFTNPFYYGYFEWPTGSGMWYKGIHTPMVTEEEFMKTQQILKRKGKPAPHTKVFAFTGLIRCGECGCLVTAEEKKQLICGACKHKFAVEGKDKCPKCSTSIHKMKNPTQLQYTYYHCTHRSPATPCKQPSIEVKDLIKQIDACLEGIEINDEYLAWGLQHLKATHETESRFRDGELKSQQQAYQTVTEKLNRLLELRLNGTVDELEYNRKKIELLKEKDRLEDAITHFGQRQSEWLTVAEDTLTFASFARLWFKEAIDSKDYQKQKEILLALGSNLMLKDKKLFIDKGNALVEIEKFITVEPEAARTFEPRKKPLAARAKASSEEPSPRWLATIHHIRTIYNSKQSQNMYIGIIRKKSPIVMPGNGFQ